MSKDYGDIMAELMAVKTKLAVIDDLCKRHTDTDAFSGDTVELIKLVIDSDGGGLDD